MNTFKPDETMLHNYLQNKLSPADEEQMELWLADHPEALEDLELDLVMKEGVRVDVNTTNASFQSTMYNSSKLFRFGQNFSTFAFLALIGVVGFILGQSLNKPNMKTVIGPNTIIVRAAQMRASTPSAIVYKDDKAVLIVLELSDLKASSYQVSLETEDKSYKATIKDLYPQGIGDLIFPLNVSDIKPGILRFAVSESENNKHIAYIDILIE